MLDGMKCVFSCLFKILKAEKYNPEAKQAICLPLNSILSCRARCSSIEDTSNG